MGRPRGVEPGGVGYLERAVRKAREADEALNAAMLASFEAGSSFRTIATVTGFSHETVRGRVAKARAARASLLS
jgi:hypothetical protein